MQRDFRRAKRRKKAWHRWLMVFILTMLAGMSLAGMRACADKFDGEYNHDYRPVDVQQQAKELKR